MLFCLIFVFLVRGKDGCGDEFCFKGIGGFWEFWYIYGDLGDGIVLELNIKLF